MPDVYPSGTLLVGQRVPTPLDSRAFVLCTGSRGYHLNAERMRDPTLSGGLEGWDWSFQDADAWITGNTFWQKCWVPFVHDPDLQMDEGL